MVRYSAIVLAGFSAASFAYDCGLGIQCTLPEMAQLLHDSRENFNTSGYVYDRVFQKNGSIVFDQRLLVEMNERTRATVAYSQILNSNVSQGVCANFDTRAMLRQGIPIVFNYSDIDGNKIKSIIVRESDC